MAIEKKIAKVYGLDGDYWLKRANPWSFWTKLATLPFLALALWSRVWLGWYAFVPVAIIFIWIIINPAFFKKPRNLDNWVSKSVLGRRYWSDRNNRAVPEKHHRPVAILNALQTIAVLVLTVGVSGYNLYLAIIGVISVYFSKMWFHDRMVWIYEDLNRAEDADSGL